ncbi:putative ribonuclease H-like domain-containing protein [Tanacetum coccineum]
MCCRIAKILHLAVNYTSAMGSSSYMGLIFASSVSVSFPDLLLSSCTVESVLMLFVSTKSTSTTLPLSQDAFFYRYVGAVSEVEIDLENAQNKLLLSAHSQLGMNMDLWWAKDLGNTLSRSHVITEEKVQKKNDVKVRSYVIDDGSSYITNEVNTAYGVSIANTQVSPASTQVSITSTQDLEQIHKDDIEDMDLKWQLALLSMRDKSWIEVPTNGLKDFSGSEYDLSNSGLDEFQQPKFEGYGPKSISEDISNEVRESPDALLVEDLVCSDDKPKAVNTARPNSVVVNVVRANLVNAVKASAYWVWRPTKLNSASITLKRHNYIDAQGYPPKRRFKAMLTGGRRTPALSFMRPFRCHVTILNTLDYLEKVDGNSNEGFFVGYSMNSKGFRVIPTLTRKVKENLHIRFLENKPIIAGDGPKCKQSGINDQEKPKNSTQGVNTAGPKVDMSSITTTYPVPSTPNTRIQMNKGLLVLFMKGKLMKAFILVCLLVSYPRKSPKRNKKDERGIVIRNKARLVAQGYTQDEVFAPVVRIEAIKLFLGYALFKDFVVYQMDTKSAFLYGKIEEEVYICQTLGFEDPKFSDKVYKVEKAKYGLHQAPRACDILLVQVYVDDIIFGSTKKELCTEFEKLMHKKFQMSSMGELTFFLGLQVTQKDDGIFISQDKYVDEILKKFGFSTVKTASTPMETSKPLMKDENAEDVDVHLYRSMIGSLMYLTSSRPDIMFVVCACARFQVTPKVSHLHAMKRIFRYLKGQPKLGLWYPKDSPFDLEAYSDSDYAGASLDRKSTTGGCQFLRSRLISWQCKKKTIVANSTTEAEYVAAANCCGQVLWIQNQMLDYGYNFMNTKIFIDNESTICIVKNLVFHSKTKHIEIRHHFIRDSNEKKLIQMIKIHTDQNVADLLTKAFDVGRFQYLIATNDEIQVSVVDLTYYWSVSQAKYVEMCQAKHDTRSQLKKKDHIKFDEEMAKRLAEELQAELEEEERVARQREEEANLISWDNTQAMMEADYELAQRLQAEEQRELTIEERLKLFYRAHGQKEEALCKT